MAQSDTPQIGYSLNINGEYHNTLDIEGFSQMMKELYRPGNTKEEFYNILQKNMQPVYDSARRQGYEVWNYL